MRLEKIVLDGFKSFADKTEFLFNNQITAIVGPNGCGKSNVVDALKWVLGEQSKKSLRSDQMADVIFSGSASRKSSGRAEVSLFFSEASALGIEQNDLQITRRLYRSGESEYLINNKVSRLKDVRELFMDTGIGVKAYSIIEQGQIAQLLTSSKTDRRAIFEEAAGISKYKAQKKEALRKLERAEQNLLRLADIAGEVQKQLRSVKLQAGKARNYLEHSQKLKELRVNYSLAQYHELTAGAERQNKTLAEAQGVFAKICADVSESDAKLSNLNADIIEKENEINRCDNSLVAVKSKIEQCQQRIEFLSHRIKELGERKESETAQAEQIQKRSGQFVAQLEDSQSRLEEVEKLTEEKTAELQGLEQKIHEVNFACAELEAELADEKSGIIDTVRRTAQLHNEIQSISVYRNNLNGQKERLSGKVSQGQSQLETLLGQKAQNSARLDDINKVIGQLQESLEDKRNQIKEIDSDVAKVNEDLAETREQRSAVKSELNVLSDMESKREGVNKAVKEILSQQKSYANGILADIVEAQPQYALAIESALAEKADAIIVGDLKALLADEAILSENHGRVKFMPTEKAEPFSDKADFSQIEGVIGRAAEFVTCDSKYAHLLWSLLGRSIVVDSLDRAVSLAGKFGKDYSFVTPEGKSLSTEGIISTGAMGQAMGLISRKSRLGELEENYEKISDKIVSLEQRIQKDVQQNEHLEKLCKDFRTSVYEANTEGTNVSSELGLIEQNIKRLTDEQPILNSEIEILQEQISDTVKKEYDSKQKLEELETVNDQRNARIEELSGLLAEKKAVQEKLAGELTELRVEMGQSNEQKKALSQAIASLRSQIEHDKNALDSAMANAKSCAEQIELSQNAILNTEAEISELFSEKETAGQQSIQLHETVEQMLDGRRQTEEAVKINRQKQSEYDEKIHEIRLELSQLEVKTSELDQRVTEELGLDIAEQYQNYSAEDIDWDAVKQEINELRAKIERLGNVNVDAIEQQEDLEKRNEFLTTQIEDLNSSKAQLEQLIEKLNKESLDKFMTTFEEVRINFQSVFRKLFGGGKADIILEDPEDLLESGIEIVARPPGKETRSISLLSGGEKTMSAIALLFAIFKSKPSPFCFLDEVDAALDEANNERFNLIVQEFKKDSQFIIITHAKRTMSIADVLFGVTMQQKGVSKRISVRFDNYEEPAENEETAVA
ncbi:MAG: chromosome segregation protein SMC [Anaerohalosphaeraceae bacterium]|nr:chromosome segregation protein SMC [Anaerohalosphaeraceae bacterium]